MDFQIYVLYQTRGKDKQKKAKKSQELQSNIDKIKGRKKLLYENKRFRVYLKKE